MSTQPIQDSSVPSTTTARDYPILDSWLTKWRGSMLWRVAVQDRHLEAWQLAPGRGVLIEVLPEGRGWDIWSNEHTNSIKKTFAVVESRYGLKGPS